MHRFDLCSTRPELRERFEPGHRDACHLELAMRAELRQLSAGETVRRESR
jgi:hypothetical protein